MLLPSPFDYQPLPDLPGLRDRKVCRTIAMAIFRLRHADAVHQIRRLLALDERFESCALEAMENFIGFAYLLPASGSHHHQYPGGLVEHTLNVVLKALSELDVPSSPETKLITLFAALLHDVGKAAHMVVQAHGRDLTWDFEAEPLADWVERNHVEMISFSWIQGRRQVGASSCEPISLLLQKHIIRRSLVPLLGIEGANQLLACQTRHLHEAGSQAIEAAIRKADGTSIHDGRSVEATLKRRFFEVLGEIIARQAHLINETDGEIFLSRSHVIVALPHERGGRCHGQAWRKTWSVIAPEFGSIGLEELTDRLLSDPTLNFVRKRGHSGRPSVFHAGCDRQLPSVIIPNDYFGDQMYWMMPPSPLSEDFFIQDLASTCPHVTLEDIGFGAQTYRPHRLSAWEPEEDLLPYVGHFEHSEEDDRPLTFRVPDLLDPADEVCQTPSAPEPEADEEEPPPSTPITDPFWG